MCLPSGGETGLIWQTGSDKVEWEGEEGGKAANSWLQNASIKGKIGCVMWLKSSLLGQVSFTRFATSLNNEWVCMVRIYLRFNQN